MPENRRDAAFLRDKAARFRAIAEICDPLTAAKLLELSVELEANAAQIEARSRRNSAVAERRDDAAG